MNRFEGPARKEARIRYLDGDFQVISPGILRALRGDRRIASRSTS